MKNRKTPIIKYSQPCEHKTSMSDLLFKRITSLLGSGEFDIVITNHTHGEAGFIDYENYTIYINPKIFPAEETLIHEVLHILKPNLDEKSIVEMSSLLFEKLNDRKRDRLIAYIKALATCYKGFKKNNLQPNYA